jgi:hypothetical protein
MYLTRIYSLHRKKIPPGFPSMETRRFRWSWMATGLAWILWVACTKVEDIQLKGKFETETGPLPQFELFLDSLEPKGSIRFDSIAEGGNFTLKFTPLQFGNIQIVEDGKAVEIQMQNSNWKADSTRYTLCKNGVCREGEIKIKNRFWKANDTILPPPDTSCILMPLRKYYLPFLGSITIKGLFPQTGTLQSLKANFYTVVSTGDSSLTYTGSGGFPEQSWAWDTIRYTGQTQSGRCVKGTIALVLGDTCEAWARDDDFFLPGGAALWPETALTANDRSCGGTLGNHLTRTDTLFDYGNYKVMNTRAGILTDTLVGGSQYYRYQRTQSGIPEDGFYYYFKNNTSGRVTKAWVRIRF